MLTNIRPLVIENIVQSSDRGLSQGGDIEIHWSATGRHLNLSPTLRSSEQQSYPRGTRASIEDDQIKIPCPSPYCEGWTYFAHCPGSGWDWSGELDPVSLSAWSKGNTSRQTPQTNSWSSSMPPHVGTQTIGRNHSHWSHLIFADESRSANGTVMAVPECFLELLEGYWIVASKKQIRLVETDPGMKRKYHMGPV